jgi:large-conductance mechanosensitive channel
MAKVETKITIEDILSYYNVLGLSIAVAVGIAGKELFFSLADDIIIPLIGFLFNKITGTSTEFLDSKNKFEIDKFISASLTFIMVVLAVIIILYAILRPLVRKEIIQKREESAELKNLQENVEKIVKQTDPIKNMIKIY